MGSNPGPVMNLECTGEELSEGKILYAQRLARGPNRETSGFAVPPQPA